jgi:hypothetical protein
MEKVAMFAYGRTILVDQDQVKFHQKKDAAVRAITKFHSVYPSLPREAKVIFDELISEQMKIIHSTSRKIRKNVQFVGV